MWWSVLTVALVAHAALDAALFAHAATAYELPVLLGTYRFSGVRTVVTPHTEPLRDWTDGLKATHIEGTSYCVWQQGVQFMLAINSPAGLVRRLCTIDAPSPYDFYRSVCVGLGDTDENVVELVQVTKTDGAPGRATRLSISTYKPFVASSHTAVARAFVDSNITAVRVSDDYPKSPPRG
mmetsp:Transcript_40049/g.98265  ORF Transcript_40049/g.98265 Transcript_40049/m.98265 type:complete len:180 (-) Transcript_40049:90-629(-)